MKKQKSIYIYQSYLCQIGGVETFLYNWCSQLKDYYDITVLYENGDQYQINRLNNIVKLIKYNKNDNYVCDIFIRNSVWGTVPNNVTSRDNRYIEIRHADYKWLLDRGVLFNQYHPFKKTNEVIGCAKHVSRKSKEVLHDNPITIPNILGEKHPKKLRLISCTRLDPFKGWPKMQKMAEMMINAGIDFEWDIYTNNAQKTSIEQIKFHPQTFDIWDELSRADYCVLLSEAEGCPYTILEALQYQVPCIVTNIDGCTELITDGINGYVVPLDMNFDINKIKRIPKCPPYDNKAKEKWIDYLGGAVYMKKPTRDEKYILVAALGTYQELHLKDGELDYIPKVGERWLVSEKRLEYLLGDNPKHRAFIKIVEEDKKNEQGDSI